MEAFIMDNTMKYKGYWAKIQYSDEDECFFGEIEGLKKASITFEGSTVKELKKDFKDAVDHYISACEAENIEPEQQCKGSLNVRLGVELHNKDKMKSINELIKDAVTLYLKN
jgi:predicted HicB family RNase H-like nuclease